VTRRDQYILMGLAMIGLVAAIWFLAIAPKRNELKELSTKVEQSEQTASTAQQQAEEFAQARLEFPRAYTNMVRLGKAVPNDPDVPSLLVQLEHAAKVAGVDFRTIEVKGQEGEEAAPTPPPASSSASASSGSGAAQPSGGSAGGTGQSSGATSASGSSAQSSGGQPPAPAAGSSGGATATAAATAPANSVAVAAAPIGTKVGPAGFPLMQLDMKFQGSFFKMADFVHQVKALVDKRNRRLRVSGRLISIDGIAFGEGKGGFPHVKANIAATTYLVPSGQGLLAGATAEGPAADTPAAPTPGSSTATAPPTAVVTGP
jgi:hypothetical protein